MAITNIVQSAVLAIKAQKGINAAGNPVYVLRKYPMKSSATNANLYLVANALGALQMYPVALISRVDTGNLISLKPLNSCLKKPWTRCGVVSCALIK